MGIGSSYGSDICLYLDVSPTRIQHSSSGTRSHGLSLLQHFKPSEQDIQARADLLDRLNQILCDRFGSGFDVEYVGIGCYAADIKQAPMEFAIVVCISPPIPPLS